MADAAMLERYWGSTGPPEPARRETLGAAVRAASVALYPKRTGFSVVPRVDQLPVRRGDPIETVRLNPILMMPPWRLGFRIGGIPIKVFRLEVPPEGGHPIPIEAPDHPGAVLFRTLPRPMTRNLLMAGTVASMVMFGKVGWWKERDARKRVVELWPMAGCYLTPNPSSTALIDSYSLRVPGYSEQTLGVDDVCFFRLMPDPRNWIDGWTPLQALFDAGAVSAGAADAFTAIFTTGVLQRLWVALAEKVEDDVQFARLEGQLEKMIGARQGIPILEEGTSLNTAGDGPNDELLSRATDWAVSLVEWLFGLKGDRHDFYADVVSPIADAIQQELEASLFTEWPDDPAYPKFLYRSLMIGSPKEQAEYWQTRIFSGQAMPDEARFNQDDPPLPDGAGQAAFVPLNLVSLTGGPSPAEIPAAPAPEKGSSDGLGGNEGKGTQPSAGDGAGGKLQAAASMRAQRRSNWGKLRDGTIDPQAVALARRLRGVMRAELKRVREAAFPGSSTGRMPGHRAFGDPLPAIEDLIAAVKQSDPEVREVLERYMSSLATSAGRTAADAFLGAGEQSEVRQAVFDLINTRSARVTQTFSDYRARGLRNAVLAWTEQGNALAGLEGAADIRDLDSFINAWADNAVHYVDGISRTESAFAFERAAMTTWADAGITVVDFVFGGGPCRTGVCEDMASRSPMQMGTTLDSVGASFTDSDAAPLHPSCTCYMVPSETQDLSKIPVSSPSAVAASVAQDEEFVARVSAKAQKAGRDFLRQGLTKAEMDGSGHAIDAKVAINNELYARLSSNQAFMDWWRANGFTTSEYAGGGTYRNVAITDLKQALDILVRQWAGTSGDSSPPAIATQLAAQEEFGLIGKASLWWDATTVDKARQLLALNETFLRTALRAMYDWTQEEFAKRGITEITMLRGQGLGNTGLIATNKGVEEVARILLQPLSSFSSEKTVARRFLSGYGSRGFVKVTIPVSRILGSCRTGFGCLNEHEFVVLASDGEVIIEWA